MENEQVKVHRQRISKITGILMITVAMIFDLIQFGLTFIPFVGWLLSACLTFIAYVIFWTWNNRLGISFSGTMKKALTAGNQAMLKWAVVLLEVIPGLDGLIPGITVNTVSTILLVRAEDAVYNATHGKIDTKKITTLAEKYNPKRNFVKNQETKIQVQDIVSVSKEKLSKDKNEEKTSQPINSEENFRGVNKKVDSILNLAQKSKEIYQNGSKLLSSRAPNKNQKEGKQKRQETEEMATFEELPLQKTPINKSIVSEDNSESAQIFSMGDIYREPIDKPKRDKPKQADEDLDLAA